MLTSFPTELAPFLAEAGHLFPESYPRKYSWQVTTGVFGGRSDRIMRVSGVQYTLLNNLTMSNTFRLKCHATRSDTA